MWSEPRSPTYNGRGRALEACRHRDPARVARSSGGGARAERRPGASVLRDLERRRDPRCLLGRPGGQRRRLRPRGDGAHHLHRPLPPAPDDRRRRGGPADPRQHPARDRVDARARRDPRRARGVHAREGGRRRGRARELGERAHRPVDAHQFYWLYRVPERSRLARHALPAGRPPGRARAERGRREPQLVGTRAHGQERRDPGPDRTCSTSSPGQSARTQGKCAEHCGVQHAVMRHDGRGGERPGVRRLARGERPGRGRSGRARRARNGTRSAPSATSRTAPASSDRSSRGTGRCSAREPEAPPPRWPERTGHRRLHARRRDRLGGLPVRGAHRVHPVERAALDAARTAEWRRRWRRPGHGRRPGSRARSRSGS